MHDQEINHLLTVLAQDRPLSSPAILNNLVYYTPRIRSRPHLRTLINAIFKGTSRSEFSVFDLFEMSQAIAQWKLEISEPVISPSEFYRIWDSCFRECYSWTKSKLAILAGILSTRDNFESLQASDFIDDTGQITKLYESWRQELFIPTWCEFLKKYNRSSMNLILIYAAISHASDASKHTDFPWDKITFHLSRQFLQYMDGPGRSEPFFEKNISRMAKTLQISLENSDIPMICDFVSQVCRASYDISFKELQDQTKKDYSRQYYSSILFTIVISLNSILQTTSRTPNLWYGQIVMILFNLNFIAEDVGFVGFDSYHSVYDVACTGITSTADQDVYYSTLKIMNGNISIDIPNKNKINRAKLMFMLKFMGSTLSELSSIPTQFIKEFIEPLQRIYMNSSDQSIRETTHVMTLSLFSSNSGGDDFMKWEAQHYLPYIDFCTQQFLQGKISDKQLMLIYQKMSSRLSILQFVDKHLSRETLHYTYLKILNCQLQQVEKQAILVKCMIYQLLFLNESYLVDWLDTTQELLSSIKFSEKERNDILSTLWDVISHSKSDIAFKWWYGQLGSLRSRL